MIPMERKELFGLPFVADVSNANVLRELRAWPLPPEGPDELPILSTPNVDQVVKLMRPENAAIHARIRKARYVLPDGQPIVWASKWKKGHELPARITGSDLFPALWPMLVKDQRRVYMVLANDAIGQKLQNELPSMRYTVPPFYSLEDVKAEQAVVDGVMKAITDQPVDYLFLGLGFPKQERLAFGIIDRYKALGKSAPLILLLGASFEFYTGFKKRAPGIFQKLGLEFFHRFLTEPCRPAHRAWAEFVRSRGFSRVDEGERRCLAPLIRSTLPHARPCSMHCRRSKDIALRSSLLEHRLSTYTPATQMSRWHLTLLTAIWLSIRESLGINRRSKPQWWPADLPSRWIRLESGLARERLTRRSSLLTSSFPIRSAVAEPAGHGWMDTTARQRGRCAESKAA